MSEITTVTQVLALPYVRHKDRARLPASPGLYFAVIDRESVGYIGISSRSIRGRWRYHPMTYRLSELGEITIAYVEVGNLAALRQAEQRAVREIDPPINLHYVKNPMGRYRQLTAAEFLAEHRPAPAQE